MAQATTVSGPKLLILIGDGEDPEEFSHPCTINAARGFSVTANTNDSNVPDCDDPETPPWLEREVASKSATISGAGTLHAPDQELFFEWLESGVPKNVQVITNIAGASGGMIYTAAYLCTQFDITGDFGTKVQANITLVSSGAVAQSAVPAPPPPP